ncbi:hypothetical protein GCM10023330_03710 [Litoribaculum gwangyangense]|uniref:Uncharacterized protein n=2 Tax=Litoribaculum gwangyangense TaxID=1130722 RepID=A0ABP9BWP8_9FLAO
MALISAPSIIIAIDDSADTSIFYSVTEEEETNKIELKASESFVVTEYLWVLESAEGIEYYFKKYPKPHLNLIFPPPEFIS